MTPSNTAAQEQRISSSSIHGFGAAEPASTATEVDGPDLQPASSAGHLGIASPSTDIASSVNDITMLIARQNTESLHGQQIASYPPEIRETRPAFVNAPHLSSSNSSPALSSRTEERGHEDGSEESVPRGMGGNSERSGISPPMETASISSDPVPSTVEVQLRPKIMVRPSSTPHSLSKVR